MVTPDELDGRRGGHLIDDHGEGDDHGAGEGGEVSQSLVDHLCCDASIYRAVLRNGSEVLDLGRSVRTATPAQKRALAVRDRGCVVPGCDRPPRDCEAHHVHWFRNGGHSVITNLALLCRRHHRQVHQRAWFMEILEDQALHFKKPDGTELRRSRAA